MDKVKQWNPFPLICLNILLKKIIEKCKKIIEIRQDKRLR